MKAPRSSVIAILLISFFAAGLTAPVINDEIREVAQFPASIIPGISADIPIKVETNIRDFNAFGIFQLIPVLRERLTGILQGTEPKRVINQGSQLQFVADGVNGAELRDLALQALVNVKNSV